MNNDNKHSAAHRKITDEFTITVGKDGTILSVSQAWIDFSVANNIGEYFWNNGANYFEGLALNGKERELQILEDVLSNGRSEYIQRFPFSLQGGETQWLEVKFSKDALALGDSQGLIVHHKPITLHSAQTITAEIILESMTEGFYLLDDHLRFIYINEIGEELLQCKSEDIVGQGLLEGFAEAENTPFHYQYEIALKENVVIEFIDYYKPLDTWFQVKASPLQKGGLAVYFQDVSEWKKTQTQLAEFAYYDYLTRLPNRKLIIDTIQAMIKQRDEFSIFHVNIDNLNFAKAVHHHNTGEIVMKKVAEELQLFVTDTCHVGRMEGNEFIIVRKSGSDEHPADFAEQIKKVFYKPFILESSQKVIVNARIGIACYPYDAETLEDLLSYAEIATYEAQDIRSSSYAFFHPQMKIQRNRNSVIEKGLYGNLEETGFYYTLQPQIDGISGEIVGVEVLSRWDHPELGEIPPLEFIYLAEETDNIVPLTSLLVNKVFTQIKVWENQYGWNLRTAINLTPSLINNTEFIDSFFELMDQHNIDPKLIEIEITEQAELTYSSKTLENMLLCKAKGISIAIDDFGTGFSMIAYLTHFPINKIKIDRSFIKRIGQDRKSDAVLKSLIHLAKSIECELLAEGVERKEEVDFLLANECSIFQGYLYDKPMKTKDFEEKYLQAGYKFSVGSDDVN